MSEVIKDKGRELAKRLEALPLAERHKVNQRQLEQSEDEHKCFGTDFNNGNCYLCHHSLASFDRDKPCLHWLLKPNDFEKNDFSAVIERYGFFRTQTYLRWVANQEAFARNINDMPEEGTGKLFETTIRFKNLEWSFSCAESDYLGHANSQHAYPHFHFQMRVDGRPFIDYGDHHIPFQEEEIITIEAMKASPDIIKTKFLFGEGMREVLTDETVKHIVNETVTKGASEKNAAFKIDTIVMADEGKKISGEDLYNIMQEAKAKNVTMASLMHKIPNAKVRVMVTPGPGVVEQAPRSKKNKPKP